ncbi:rhamnan synthesis F family protein [Pseudomonas paraveronii]|uniref:rhamnan synthesis F family protein n=1 Tax=Pseudomonas paraveronii TaxID=3040598 RepID=UPI002AB2B7A8|nr:rhamnan synthesis F family protein [Pseudomonas sp. FLM 11]
MKRICLFAGYNATGIIQPYVIDYLKELSLYCDVYYMADGVLQDGELKKLDATCKGSWLLNHGKYDFGSYSELAKSKVGWATISKYDELIFANDSCFCVNDFSSVFNKMQHTDADAWGLLATDENNKGYFYTLAEYLKIPIKMVPLFCVGSYFLAFRKNVISDPDFVEFVNSVGKEDDRYDVCIKYEMGLTKFLQKKDIKISAYIGVVYRNVTIYDEQAFRLLKKGFPLIKVRIFKDNPLSIQNLHDWPGYIAHHTKSPKIYEYLKAIGFGEAPITNTQISQQLATKNHSVEAWLPPIFRLNWKELARLLVPPKLLAKARQMLDKSKNRTPLPTIIEVEKPAVEKFVNSDASAGLALLDGYKDSDSFIIYFNVARDVIGGGMLSINRFAKHTADVISAQDYKLLVSGLPLENSVVEYSMFEPSLPMVHFATIAETLSPKRLIIHIPEFYTQSFIMGITPLQRRWLKTIPELQINIMNQNHDFFPDRYYIECCRELTDDVTITAAHVRYATQELASSFDCPVSLLTPFLPEFYRVPFVDKKNIIAISPDNEVPLGGVTKDEILAMLKTQLPDYEFVLIQNMTLEEYKLLISKARFSITFGEGYDGYYLEPFLSDSIAFAVYNQTFFPKDFEGAPTIYSSWQSLYECVVSDIRRLEKDGVAYAAASKETERLIKTYTNDTLSMDNLQDFYSRNFSFMPEIYQDDPLFSKGSNVVPSVHLNSCNV